jgi:hypothetical protein
LIWGIPDIKNISQIAGTIHCPFLTRRLERAENPGRKNTCTFGKRIGWGDLHLPIRFSGGLKNALREANLN